MNLQDKQMNAEAGLYVGDLEDGITEEQLFVEFRKHGTLQFVKLHRYPFIGKSKRFAFLYFSTPEEAKKAKDAMNYKELLRHPIRVTSIKEHDKDSNVFFAGFDSDVTLKQLDEYFSNWGPLFSLKLSNDENRKSRGYGWAQFESKEQADALVAECTEKGKLSYKGKETILVKKFTKKGSNDREDRRCNLYVKNFWPPLENQNLEDEAVMSELETEMKNRLQEWFLVFGNIISIFVKIDIQRRAPYAFVSFEKNADAKKAQQELGNKKDLTTGRPMYVGWAQSRKDRKQQRDNNVNARYVYMSHLARNVTEDDIRTTLKESGYGDIVLIRLEKLQLGFTQIIRIGYLVFDQAADASRLIRTFKEAEVQEKLKGLFEPTQDQSLQFQHLFPQQHQNRGQKKHQQPRMSPFRKAMYPPMGPQFMPNGMPMQNMQGMPPFGFPGPMPMQQNMGMAPYNPRRQQYNPHNPHNNPRHQGPRQQGGPKTEYIPAPVAFDKKQDLLDLLNNMGEFDRKSEDDKRKQLGVMLLNRIKAKHQNVAEDEVRKVTAILIDSNNFEIEEILGFLKDEANFNESVDDAFKALKEDEQ